MDSPADASETGDQVATAPGPWARPVDERPLAGPGPLQPGPGSVPPGHVRPGRGGGGTGPDRRPHRPRPSDPQRSVGRPGPQRFSTPTGSPDCGWLWQIQNTFYTAFDRVVTDRRISLWERAMPAGLGGLRVGAVTDGVHSQVTASPNDGGPSGQPVDPPTPRRSGEHPDDPLRPGRSRPPGGRPVYPARLRHDRWPGG